MKNGGENGTSVEIDSILSDAHSTVEDPKRGMGLPFAYPALEIAAGLVHGLRLSPTRRPKNRPYASINSEKVTYPFRPSSNSIRKHMVVSLSMLLKVLARVQRHGGEKSRLP
jgi:hypothetical protein